MKKIFISFILLFLLCPFLSHAANYYVLDGASGTTCADWTNACDTIAAAETVLQAAGRAAGGDTIYIGDGAYTNATFNVPTNGTAVITIKKSTVADHGTETGYVEASHNGTATITSTSGYGMYFTTSYWKLDGVFRASETSGYGIKIIGTTGSSTYGSYISAANGITIRYVEITSPTVPITDGCIASNTCTNCAVSARNGTSDVLIEYSYLHDVRINLSLISGSTNYTVKNCYLSNNDSTPTTHSEVISVGYGTHTNVTLASNKIVNIEGTSTIFFGNASVTTGINVWNNLIYFTSDAVQTGAGNGIFHCANSGTSCSDVYIYNNTIVDLPATDSGKAWVSYAAAGTNWLVKNNLWYCDAASCGSASNEVNANITYDNNWYSGVTYNASENGAINSNTDPFTNEDTYDYSLAALSDPIGEGTDLSAKFTNDFAGNVRSAPWDIGAYKSGEAAPDTDPPVITTKVIDATGTVLTVTLDEDVTVNNGTGFTLACANASGEGLSYVSESGGVLTFNITGVAIDDDDTCTLDYASTGGIVDAALNALETIGDPVAVDNQSTNTPEAESFTVTVSVVAGGCTLSSLSQQSVETGETTVLTATCQNGWRPVWSGTCGGTASGANNVTYTTSAITSDCGVTLTPTEIKLMPW
jgi:hypothetical protein